MPLPNLARTAASPLVEPANLLSQGASEADASIELESISGSAADISGRRRDKTDPAQPPRPSRLQPRDNGDGWDDAWADDGDNSDDRDTRALFDEEDYGSGGDLHSDEETGLSAAGRLQRADLRRQRTRLDRRFVEAEALAEDLIEEDAHTRRAGGEHGEGFGFGDGRLDVDDQQSRLIMAALTEAERKEADKHVLRRLLINGSLIGLWYLFSLSISLYNKWMFGSNFPFPLFTTSIHMLVQFFLSCLVLYFVPSLRPGAGRWKRRGHGESSAVDDDVDKRNRPDGKSSTGMTGWFYFTRIGPCGAATGLDIGLGNASLKLITLTFYTMCKSSSLAFVLLFAFAFRLETPTVRLVAIIATMTVGVVMMVAGEVEFNPFGFFLVITAAFFSGFRWGLTQIMLLRNPATSNPFSSIFYLAPVMFVTLFSLAVPMEGFPALADGFRTLAADFGPVRTPLLVLFPGAIAFLMTASEFALLQRTSVVTLSIAGIFKEVITITTATLVFHDKLTLVNLLGLLITLVAIFIYNYIKITKMRKQAQLDVHKGHQRHSSAPATEAGGSSSSGSPLPTPLSNTDGEHDSDVEGENDGENAGLLRKPGPPQR